MSLTGVLELVKNHPEFRRHLAQVEAADAPATITLRAGSRSAYLAALWKERQLPMLVLTPRPEESRRIHDQMVTYLGEVEPVYLLPEPEVLPFERLAVDARTSNQRLAALAAVSVLPAVLTPNGDNVNDSVRISYRIQGIESGDVAIEILDLSGRTVRELSPGPRGQGTYVEDWNGTDESGVLVAPGVYLCRVAVSTQSGDEETLKLLPVAY